nr:S4 domain-containing protein [Desulfurispira natronophila]
MFLKKSRLIKRRPLAKKMCDDGMININGRVAKAGHKLHVGDTLCVNSASRFVEVRIEEIPTGNVRKNQASELYHILKNERKQVNILDWFDDEEEDEFD